MQKLWKNSLGLWYSNNTLRLGRTNKRRNGMESVEFAILDWIQQHLRCGVLDTVLPAVSWICNHGEVWIILAAVLLLAQAGSLGRCFRGPCSGAGPCLLQSDFKAAGGPGAAFCGEYGGGAADGAAAGRIVPLRPHGGLLCGGICAQSQRKPAVETSAGIGGSHCLFQTLSVCPLAQRRPFRRGAGGSAGIRRGLAGRTVPAQAGAQLI